MLALSKFTIRSCRLLDMKKRYDCSSCPGYCCSYPRIELRAKDLKRLARYLGISKKKVCKRYIDLAGPEEKKDQCIGVMHHQKDGVLGPICIFFDKRSRRCGIYDARPRICRDYPGQKKCGYFEFLRFERKAQEDPDYIALTGN